MNDKDRRPFRTAFGLLRRTTPFLFLNAAVYAVFFLIIAIWLGIFGGLAVLFAERLAVLAVIFFVIAVAGPAALLSLARRYLLYLVQGAHIAVATTLLFDGSLPAGEGQIAFGRAQVQQRFRDVSVLFAVDRAVHGVVSAFTRRFVNLAERLPLGQGVGNAARVGASVVNRSLSYVDEAILSYAIVRQEENVWRSARHGVILYAQSYKPILGAAVKIWLLGRAVFIGLLIVLGIPAVLVLLTFDAVWFQIVVLVGVVMLAWLITAATYEPFAMLYSLTTYHRAIEGAEVDPVWDRRLQQVSNKFKEIVGKAQEGGGEPDPLDTATVSPDAVQLDSPGGPAAPAGPTGGAPGGFGGGSNPLGGLRSVTKGGGLGALGGIVGDVLSQVGQPTSNPQQPPTPPQQSPGTQPPADTQPTPPAPQPEHEPPLAAEPPPTTGEDDTTPG